MRLVLYPRLTAPSRVRVWLGGFECAGAFAPQWWLDGQPATPTVLRAFEPVRTGPQAGPRAHWGLFEFPASGPVSIVVRDPGSQQTASLSTRPLPGALVEGGPPLRVLLLSCFYVHQAERGGLAASLARLRKAIGPDGIDLTLLLGDQVYLDLPTLEQFHTNADWLAENFERKYVDNWAPDSDLAPILREAPFLAIPDDHEFWNNAPELSPWMDTTWTQKGRRDWHWAASEMFRAFQAPGFDFQGRALSQGAPVAVDLGAVRFFVMDTRSDRREDASACTRRQYIDDLAAWAGKLAPEQLGVFVTGQSLFRDKVGGLEGAVADYELPNYRDFPELLRALDRSRSSMLYVTGDVHWGRVARYLRPWQQQQAAEVICSPSALVASPGDPLKSVWGWVHNLFGHDAWPRHANPDRPPQQFPTEPLDSDREPFRRVEECQGITGDQIAVLEFHALPGRIEVRPRFAFATPRSLPDPVVPPIVFSPGA